MKIVHTSDWHLGKQIHEHLLIDDQRHILKQLLDYLHDNHHDALLIAGDIYDRSIPSADAVGLLSWFLTTLRSFSSIAVLIIPGNHDSAGRLSFCSEIMALSNIFFRSDLERVDEPVRIFCGDSIADFYMLPFLDPLAFHIDGEDIEKSKAIHETAVAIAIDKILKKLLPGHINILAAHLYTSGGLTCDSERRFVGTAGDVDSHVLDHFDYVALGHLHRPQSINSRMYYSGSLMKYSFSETLDSKSVISLDISNDILQVNHISFSPYRDMKKIRGTLDELLYNPKFENQKDCYLEIELADGGIITNPMSILRDRYPYIMTVRQKVLSIRNDQEGPVIDRVRQGIDGDFFDFHQFIYGKDPDKEKMDEFIEASKNIGNYETP